MDAFLEKLDAKIQDNIVNYYGLVAEYDTLTDATTVGEVEKLLSRMNFCLVRDRVLAEIKTIYLESQS